MVRGTLRHRKVELNVAVKIWPDLEPRLEEERYRMECAVLQRVTGLRGTCQVLGTSQVNGRKCIISKLQHRSLQDLLRGQDGGGPGARLDLKTTLRIAIDVAQALVQVHGAGACYLDLHPANIVFDKHDSLFLSNFRLARILPEVRFQNCQTAAPKPRTQNPQISPRARTFSLGVEISD
jgi:tRNA A-37 threonylcarbamoyl transferase component Bud32